MQVLRGPSCPRFGSEGKSGESGKRERPHKLRPWCSHSHVPKRLSPPCRVLQKLVLGKPGGLQHRRNPRDGSRTQEWAAPPMGNYPDACGVTADSLGASDDIAGGTSSPGTESDPGASTQYHLTPRCRPPGRHPSFTGAQGPPTRGACRGLVNPGLDRGVDGGRVLPGKPYSLKFAFGFMAFLL